jgi:predicted molibdopterin-dependent oxidoreductase YjgC
MPDAPSPSAKLITLTVNGRTVTLPEGSTVAAALLNAGVSCRISESGKPRAPLCGMGICFECRAVVDGAQHRRTCQIVCRTGMTVETQR